ncbi:hypothetical protein Xbed_02548 [Xenorhabdus beddingii]|uniref:Uncharacterized protein n=1 Tax=Xenorhabdus beddingii TaxID=40578 RepID=A0A1Y2SMK0_9GAMM|nr:hypothetical protein Xbed_02548 [Xenorhabdus beddingii]
MRTFPKLQLLKIAIKEKRKMVFSEVIIVTKHHI